MLKAVLWIRIRMAGSGIKDPELKFRIRIQQKVKEQINKTVNSGLFVPVLRIRIRGLRIISLDTDPYQKMAGSGIRIRIKLYGSGSN